MPPTFLLLLFFNLDANYKVKSNEGKICNKEVVVLNLKFVFRSLYTHLFKNFHPLAGLSWTHI